MTMMIPGSEIFSSRPVDPDELRRSLPSGLQTHTVSQERADRLDPLTYEVVRHRLWSVTDEMGEALKRMSGSPIAAKPRVGEVRNRVETSLSPTRAGRDATKWRL